MSNSVRPHRRQPTRLPRPWDSPSKNAGVGCHFLLQCMKVKSESEVAQSCPTLSNPMDCSLPGSPIHGIFQARELEWGAIAFSTEWCSTLQPIRLLCPWDFPGESTGMGCHCLLHNGMLLRHKKEKFPFATTWMKLRDLMLNEISQTEKDTVFYRWNIKKK